MATKGRIKKSIKKFTSGVKSEFNSKALPKKSLTASASGSKSPYGIGAYSNKPKTSLLTSKKAFYPTPTGKAPTTSSKYGIGGYSSKPSTSILTTKGNTYGLKPTTGPIGGQTLAPKSSNPVGGQTKVPLNYTPVPSDNPMGPQSIEPRSSGGSSFGRPAPVNADIEADMGDTVKGETTAAGPAIVSGGGSTTSALRVGTTASPSAAVTGSTASAAGSGLLVAPAGSEGYLSDYDYTLSNEERARQQAYEEEQAYYEKQKNERVSREQIMRDALRQFQGEIDATNSVFADKLKQTQLAGLDRLGMSRAENFNAGAVNSSFGNAALERVNAYNRDAEGAINNEKLALISQIESAAREAGDRYYQEKKAAKEAGLESYMRSLTNAQAAKQAISNDIANNMLMSNVGIEQLSPDKLASIAKSAGVSVQSIKSAYEEAKKLAEAEQLAAEQEAAKAERESQFDLSKGQSRYDQYGNLLASNMGADSGNDGLSSEAISLAEQINSGLITLDKVPSAMRGEVSLALNTLPDPRTAELDTVLETIDELAANPKLDNILGPIEQRTGGLFGKAATAKNLYQQLTGILALEGRNKLKGSGAISDFEFKVLKEAQSALGRNLNTTEFKAQLEKVRNVLEKRKAFLESSRGGAKPVKTIDDYRNEFPQATDEELQALYEEEQLSFNQVGSGTYNAQSIANAIKQVESQGNYNARGGSGETGAYQFMPATWREWAGEFLGNPNAPQTPENQDYVAVAKIDSLIKQGYSPQEIALIWNGGTPTVKRGTNKYGVAYDSGAYANKVLNALG